MYRGAEHVGSCNVLITLKSPVVPKRDARLAEASLIEFDLGRIFECNRLVT